MSRLGSMPAHLANDNVISMASARAHRNGTELDGYPRGECSHDALMSSPMHTVIIQASNIQANQEVHRQIGLDASMSLAELHHVLDKAFMLEGESPWYFVDSLMRVDPTELVADVLRAEGDSLVYIWGLWRFDLHCVGLYTRDNGTPRALCIGGSGGLHDSSFDQAAINAALTGTETIRDVLASVRPEIRCVVDRSGVFDFIPLLQAMDLRRGSAVNTTLSRDLRTLPVEKADLASDAFWSCVLALACLGDTQLFDEVVTATIAALGWVDDDGAELSADAITAECARSLAVLESVGAYGSSLKSPVERLDIFRELVRA